MALSRFQKRAGIAVCALIFLSLLIRLVVELQLEFAVGPTRKLLVGGTSVFDKLFEVVVGQAESFQTESQLLVGAALVSGMVKALEAAGTENIPVWVGVRRVLAIFVASAVSIGFLLTFMGSWILLLGLAVGENLFVGSVVLKTVLAWVFTIPAWLLARRLLAVVTVQGIQLENWSLVNKSKNS